MGNKLIENRSNKEKEDVFDVILKPIIDELNKVSKCVTKSCNEIREDILWLRQQLSILENRIFVLLYDRDKKNKDKK